MADIMNGIEKTVITPDLRIEIEEDRIVDLMENLSSWEYETRTLRVRK